MSSQLNELSMTKGQLFGPLITIMYIKQISIHSARILLC